MKRLSLLVVAVALALSIRTEPAEAAEKSPIIVAAGRTVVAFFRPGTDAQLQKDADTNEALADFQLYANQVREPFKRAGIEFHELYTASFRIRVGKTVSTFRPKTDVGYYFIVPGKKPRIEYGVMTDADLLQVAYQYFASSTR